MSGSQYPLIVDQGASAKVCTIVFSNVDGGCEWELSSEGLIAANNSGSWLQKKDDWKMNRVQELSCLPSLQKRGKRK
jgi:hypothetical protein